MDAMRKEHAMTNREVTRQGNVGNYEIISDGPEFGLRIDKSKFKLENMAQRASETIASIWDYNDEEGADDMLHFFGYRKSPEPSESSYKKMLPRQPKVKYQYMPPVQETRKPVIVHDWYDREDENNENETTIGQWRRGTWAWDEDPDAGPHEEVRWPDLNRMPRALPVPNYSLNFNRDHNNYDMARISKLFDIDFAAFNKNYVPPENKRTGKSKKQFTLRTRQDIKDLMEHVLSINNLQEPQMLFSVETSAHMIQATLGTSSRKSVILRIIRALLNNDTHEVFQLIERDRGYDVDTGGADARDATGEPPRNGAQQ